MENVALYFCKTHFTSWRLFSLLCILTRLLILSLYFCPFPAPNRVINSSQESWLPFTQIWEFFLLLLILWWSSLSLIPSRNMLFDEILQNWMNWLNSRNWNYLMIFIKVSIQFSYLQKLAAADGTTAETTFLRAYFVLSCQFRVKCSYVSWHQAKLANTMNLVEKPIPLLYVRKSV